MEGQELGARLSSLHDRLSEGQSDKIKASINHPVNKLHPDVLRANGRFILNIPIAFVELTRLSPAIMRKYKATKKDS